TARSEADLANRSAFASGTGAGKQINSRIHATNAVSENALNDAEEEFDSPETIAAIAAAITALGHEVELLGDGRSLVERLLAGDLPDMVFNIAEGRGIGRSREAWVPAMLEMFGIPYSGSDPLTLAATLDKHCAKQLVAQAGICVPAGVLVDGSIGKFTDQLATLQMPLIVKPAFEGSSKGISSVSVIDHFDQLTDAIESCRSMYRQPVLVEEFIAGDELTVGLIGNQTPAVIGVMRVVPRNAQERFVYSLDVKRDWRRQVLYEAPAQLTAIDEEAVRHAAVVAFGALGCRDVARIDFRLRNGVPYFLEANPLSGLTPGSSDLVLLAEGMGIEYGELIARIVAAAIERHRVTDQFADRSGSNGAIEAELIATSIRSVDD
ncbi:MAG TPA: ATP-grasp domain-containing protein, partial [Pirellulales bacterium]